MPRRSRRYKIEADHAERDKLYKIDEAVERLQSMRDAVSQAGRFGVSGVKFDQTAEAHFHAKLLNKDDMQKHSFRAKAALPHGIGKQRRVAVVASDDLTSDIIDAGGTPLSIDELNQQIADSRLEFEVLIAAQDQISQVGRLGKHLGPKGLMPSPRSGTLVPAGQVVKAIKENSGGNIEAKMDRGGNFHMPIGKLSFEPVQLVENFHAALIAIQQAKPTDVKGVFPKTATIAGTMTPGIKIDLGKK